MNIDVTKIFISSSSQSKLMKMRNTLYDFLEHLGHHPMMFERNLGPWQGTDSVKHCLDAVRECDLFFLFVSDRAGTYLKAEDRTVTHLEVEVAFHTNKYIVVFVDSSIHHIYFSQVRRKIVDAVNLHIELYNEEPKSIVELIKDIKLPRDVDEYTWALLYDLSDKGIYWEQLDLGVDLCVPVKKYLSSIFKHSVAYLTRENDINNALVQSETFVNYTVLATHNLALIKNGTISSSDGWRFFLTKLRGYLLGGFIVDKVGEHRIEPLGMFENCEGISLYIKQGEVMKKVHTDGLSKGEPFYAMEEPGSYVVQGYKLGENPGLFFDTEKNVCYFTVRCHCFVLCMHFRLKEKWPLQRVIKYNNQIINSIIGSGGNQYFIQLTSLILGGMTQIGQE